MLGPHFGVGDRVRVKRGVVDANYLDFPLGGWTGNVLAAAADSAGTCLVRWTPATLAAAHPAYHVRCERDSTDPETYRIAEDDLESDPNGPLSIEQPTQLVPKPLASEFQDDRIRAVFGLTTDDPLPPRNWDTDEKYYHYLKATLQFPFTVRYIDESVPYDNGRDRTGTVIQMFEDFHTDEGHGAMCQIREGDRLREMPLAELDVPEDNPNFEIIDDYTYWLYNAGDEVWDDDLPDDFAEDFEPTDEEDYDDVVDFSDAVFPEKDDFDDEEPPPKLASRNRTGRNDPCPCGSGKKFKKCCLKK